MWFLVFLAATSLYGESPSRGYRLPLIDLAGDTARQTIVDREAGQYLGHPTTVLLEDGKTMLIVYPKGHGKGAIQMKRSTDGGRTWSGRLTVPGSWATSKETPTIHRVIAPNGTRRLILFSGLYPIRMSVSENDGQSWSELKPIGNFGGIVAMGDVLRLQDGRYMAVFHDDGRFLRNENKEGKFYVYKTVSADGGLSWSEPAVIATHTDAHLCEPGLVRSPDGREIAMLMRENSRKRNSFVAFSRDEGGTWSEPRELPAALTGDRHVARYAPDGRLFITFRDTTLESQTAGDWVAWVGRYQDIVDGKEGQYRVRLMDNKKGRDCCYPGVELLPDGTIFTTTYGHWTEGEQPYIASVRLKLSELDQRARVPIDNEFARVVRAFNHPGQKSGLHKHDVNRVMIHLDAGRMRLAFQGGPVNDIPFRPGEVRWDPKGGLHTSENIGGTNYNIVEVELKKPGGAVQIPKDDATESAPKFYKVELDNPQVRVLRARYGPGESSPMHAHPLPRLVVFLTGFHAELTAGDGAVSTVDARAGDLQMFGAGRHSARNTGSQPFEVVVVEFK